MMSLPFSLSNVIMTSVSRATLISSSTKLLKVSFIVLVLRKREVNGTGGINSEIREDTEGHLNTEKGALRDVAASYTSAVHSMREQYDKEIWYYFKREKTFKKHSNRLEKKEMCVSSNLGIFQM